MFKKIMTVCTGNICRSPLAEAELRHYLPSDFTVCSSGLHAVVGAPAQETVSRIATKRGLDLSRHKGTQITEELALENDLILVMTPDHKMELETRFPAARGRVFLLGKWEVGEIQDPYGGTETLYASVDLMIQKAVKEWILKIVNRERR
jgi:protein-tyrosine phosphatase